MTKASDREERAEERREEAAAEKKAHAKEAAAEKKADDKAAAAEEKADAKEAAGRTHHKRCGEVGRVGKHGDLGSNAARKTADDE